MRQQGDVNKAPAVKCLAHGGEQDGQVGTQAPTGEAFNNYFVICLEADSHNRQGQEQKASAVLEPGRVQAVRVG